MTSKNPYNLINKDNYKNDFTIKNLEIYHKTYIKLLKDFLKHAEDSILIKNNEYHKYVLEKGIQTFTSVFLLILTYCKDLDMTIYHCQKGCLYYIEFIGQIGDDNHSFLQLSSTDASLFVYRKTIYEINNDFRKISELTQEQELFMSYINHYTIIINDIIKYINISVINHNEWNNIYTILNDNIKKIENIYNLIDKFGYNKYISCLFEFNKTVINCNFDIQKVIELDTLFIKNFQKNNKNYTKNKISIIKKNFSLEEQNIINFKHIINSLFIVVN
jgi:hypothetical protein